MKLAIIAIVLMLLSACSSLRGVNDQHTLERKQLRTEQKEKKKELGEEHKLEVKKLSKKLEIERELLKTRQALQLVEFGSVKYNELKSAIETLETLLK